VILKANKSISLCIHDKSASQLVNLEQEFPTWDTCTPRGTFIVQPRQINSESTFILVKKETQKRSLPLYS